MYQFIALIKCLLNVSPSGVKGVDVIEFLMQSKVFPQSILFCMKELKTLILSLPNSAEIIKSIDDAIVELENKEVRVLKNGLLHDFIDEIQIYLVGIHNGLA